MKSYKREVAGALLAFWAVLTMYLFFFAPNVAELESIHQGLTMFIVPPSLCMFGFHMKLSKDKSTKAE